VEILKDRPSWFRDCRSLEIFKMLPAGTGGTIELVYMQVSIMALFFHLLMNDSILTCSFGCVFRCSRLLL
jgi:hypothetical protein